jgi:protein-S-isoprenylcysteine O-methyltransferase Ste14
MEHLRLFTLPNGLFYLANLLWILEFVVFRNKQKRGQYQEKFSFWFLTISIVLVIGSTIFFSRLQFGLLNQTNLYPYLQWFGITLYGLGLWLRYRGSHVLGQQFTRHVAVSKDMQLSSNGPYRYLRHPLYLGLFLIVIAFPIFVGNWFALVITGPFVFIGFLWRMKLEEKALIRLHPSYSAWRKKRYLFIPFIY